MNDGGSSGVLLVAVIQREQCVLVDGADPEELANGEEDDEVKVKSGGNVWQC